MRAHARRCLRAQSARPSRGSNTSPSPQRYGDGRETMAFSFDCAPWSSTCNTVVSLATMWMRSGGAVVPPPPPPPPGAPLNIAHRVLVLTTPGARRTLCARAPTLAPSPARAQHTRRPRPRRRPPLARAGFTQTDFFETVMDGYGVPYAELVWDKAASPRANLSTALWAPDGSAKYSAILMCAPPPSRSMHAACCMLHARAACARSRMRACSPAACRCKPIGTRPSTLPPPKGTPTWRP